MDVQKTFEAVYENGVLRPLTDPELPNHEHVVVTVSAVFEPGDIPTEDPSKYFDAKDWAGAQKDRVSLESVMQVLSPIRGSLSDTVSESREERW